jgi:hypothetical protein
VGSVTVRDRAPGTPDFELEIELESVEVTAAEVISSRAVAELGGIGGTVPRPIVAISELELTLNGARDNARELDAEREVARRMTAFERGRFVLVVAGRQIQRADETMTLTPETPVTFVHLVPLRDGEDQVRRWIASDAIEYPAPDDGEHRPGICEERLRVPGSAGRQFVLLSVGEPAPWIREATRDVLADLQTHDPIARLILDATQGAFGPQARIVLGSRRQGAGEVEAALSPARLIAHVVGGRGRFSARRVLGYGQRLRAGQTGMPIPHSSRPPSPGDGRGVEDLPTARRAPSSHRRVARTASSTLAKVLNERLTARMT